MKKHQQYVDHVEAIQPKRNLAIGMLKAFWVGGLICVIGQGFSYIGELCLKLDKDATAAFVAIVMVFLGALLTGLGVYDQIGAYAGAGSVVPITGFSNSVVAPAMEFKHEGYVMGVGAKLFSLAGPVLVYGICSSVVAGIIALIFKG
nr:stage V sporulation protein AC [bacterium]